MAVIRSQTYEKAPRTHSIYKWVKLYPHALLVPFIELYSSFSKYSFSRYAYPRRGEKEGSLYSVCNSIFR